MDALKWNKSSYSGGNGGNCVEVMGTVTDQGEASAFHVRDSKRKTGPIVKVSPEAWRAFLQDSPTF
jgi:hypothetical protein